MSEVGRVSPDVLHLDPRNPRMPEHEFGSESEILSFLIQNYDIDELVLSILGTGWLDFEPFIVLKGENIVLEGNRRLAALRLIRSAEIRALVGYELPKINYDQSTLGASPFANDLTIPVRFVNDRREAYVFLGFKHINGPYKWKSLAKAKFASDWLEGGQTDVAIISRMLGDSHNTVVRLINGYRVLKKAEGLGFDTQAITGYELAISHIYTALPRPAIREFLGIGSRPTAVITEEDIPSDRGDNLIKLMTWIYGQEPAQKAVVRTQNPDLGILIRVIASDSARDELIATGDLYRAEARLTPPAERFDVAVRDAARACEGAYLLVEGYDGNRLLLEIVNNTGRMVLSTRNRMEEISRGQGSDDPLASFADATRKP